MAALLSKQGQLIYPLPGVLILLSLREVSQDGTPSVTQL